MSKNYSFTSESVCNGHPDKICDSISDAILDAVLVQDKYGRVAVETLVTTNKVVIAGEITANAKLNYEQIARTRITELGYTDEAFNFSDKSPIEILIHEQSVDIAKGVDEKGAGDQGMMFGYACRDTASLMPLPITMAHNLVRKIDKLRENNFLKYLRPDGKSQVTIEYLNGKPHKLKQVVLAVPHKEKVSIDDVAYDLKKHVIKPVILEYGFKKLDFDIVINGTGVWHIGGPASDTGVTGRKIIVDTYGGYARVGGGAFSGKDPTKVDRSGAYAARFIAKNIVAENLADEAEVRIAYYIGAKKPAMLDVETFGTEKTDKKVIMDFMHNLLDVSVSGIIEKLDLRRPIYQATSAYGHFGRSEFSWEKII